MKCPIDGDTLSIADRNGIEIDYCPTCRGVWLDRGELDKIIERSQIAPPPARPGHQNFDEDYIETRSSGKKKKKKRGGFLEEIFDFLD